MTLRVAAEQVMGMIMVILDPSAVCVLFTSATPSLFFVYAHLLLPYFLYDSG